MAIAHLECPACECRFQVDIDEATIKDDASDRGGDDVTCPDCGNKIPLPAKFQGRVLTTQVGDSHFHSAGEQSSNPIQKALPTRSKSTGGVAPVTRPKRPSPAPSRPPLQVGPVEAVPTPQRLRERRRTPPRPSASPGALIPSRDARSPGERLRPKVARPSAPISDDRVTIVAAQPAPSQATPPVTPLTSVSPPKPLPLPPSASQLARKRSGRKLGILLATAGGSVLALLVVALVLTQVSWRGQQQDSGKVAAVDEPPSDSRENAARDGSSPTEEITAPTVDPERVAEVWTRSYPYLVKLTIERAGEVQEASGVIVDNRGWVATSFPAIAGADRIRLSRASSTATDQGILEPTSFESRGLIAVDPHSHVALLSFSPSDVSIDRDPVLSIDEFPAVDSTLVAAGIPAVGHAWLAGCHLNEKRKVKPQAISELASVDLKDSALLPGRDMLAADPQALTTMVLDLPVDPRFEGGPLLRTDGAVAGILVSPPDEESDMWAVSVVHIRKLREFSRDVPIPFDSAALVALRSEINKPRLGTDDAPMTHDASDLNLNTQPPPGTLTSREYLTKLLAQCREANWNPQDPGEYLVFQQLGTYLTAAEEVAVDESLEEGLRLLLNQAATEIRDEMSRTPWPNDETIKKINQLAIESLSGVDDGFYGFAQVVLPPGLAPEINGAGSVVMRLLGHEQQIILPVSRSFDQLRTDSQWLIVGSKQGGRELIVKDEEGESHPMSLIFAIHLSARPELIAGEVAE